MTSLFGLNLITGEPTEGQLRAWKPSILVSFDPSQANRLAKLAKEWNGRVAYRMYPDDAINRAKLAAGRAKDMARSVSNDVILVSQNEPGMSWEMVNYEVAFATAARQLGYEVVVGAVGVGWPIKTTGVLGGNYVDWQGDPENALARFMAETEGVYYGGHEYHERRNPNYGFPFYVGRNAFLFHQFPAARQFVLEYNFDSDHDEFKGIAGMDADLATSMLITSAETRYGCFPNNVLGVALFGWGNGDRWEAYNVQKLGENNLNRLFSVQAPSRQDNLQYTVQITALANTSLWAAPGAGDRLIRFSVGQTAIATWQHRSADQRGMWKRMTIDGKQGWMHMTAFSFDMFAQPQKMTVEETEIVRLRRALDIANARVAELNDKLDEIKDIVC